MFAEAPRLLPEPGSEPGADRKPRPGLPGPERGARTGSGTGTGTREPPPRPFPWRPPAPRRGAQEELPHAGLAQVAPPAWSSKPSAGSRGTLEARAHVAGPRAGSQTQTNAQSSGVFPAGGTGWGRRGGARAGRGFRTERHWGQTACLLAAGDSTGVHCILSSYLFALNTFYRICGVVCNVTGDVCLIISSP